MFGAVCWRVPRVGNHCNYHGDHICLVNCHRNSCSVLCVGVGTRLANHYLVMGDFIVGTIYLLGGHDSRHSPIGFHSALLKSPFVGNHCNLICLVNCYHWNACSVLCVGVGTHLANCYLAMGDFTVGTVFTQPLAGNGRLRQLRYSGFIGQNVDNLSCMN
jgi:hypothetical protein